ncbi:MAG: hypothetical protein H2B00_04690 [Nitrosopumilaceae archaeon]|uniref:Uncharacterized protein n=1 Tax=Candidatus Nitrosomaritimum aestuariumsis TaxID=3342354 RepID=A0AC60VZK7_9ARCH|nr:hypothetical protein [Nitrosopumilaceae archaeon]MBA4461789.1 hypothetical protein [Nitrosopumilaceae archaeon]NCF22691.1 hypothetical protein [Nitrosopumilaceae archaeon]
MKRIFLVFAIVGIFAFTTNFAFSQEIGLATFQETAQVIVDRRSQEVTASLTLQTTSIQEIKVPSDLEKKIREHERITSIIVTNQNECILGVVDDSCIMINVQRDPSDKGIIAIQDSTKEVAEQFISEINQAFDTDAKFHSVYVHSDDETNRILETSGAVSGRGTVSAVYVMPMEDTDSMYEKISAILIPKIIRDSDGFYLAAKELSFNENSKMTFSIIPFENNSLLQLKLSVSYPEAGKGLTEVSPLEFLDTDELNRSEYFSSGFYPLNSIFQVVILSPESTTISNIKGNTVPTQIMDGEKIPTQLTEEGWIFDPDEGQRIQGKYIFGKESSIEANDLMFVIGEQTSPTPTETSFDESIAILAIIIVGGVAAAIFFLKGYKK